MSGGTAHGRLIRLVAVGVALVAMTPAAGARAAERITFGSDRGGQDLQFELWSMNTDGSALLRLTNNPGDDGMASTSPDGSQIAFARSPHDPPRSGHPEDHYDIYVMKADGSNERQLTRDTGGNNFVPVWSPDGKKIAFSTDRDAKPSMFPASPLDVLLNTAFPPPPYNIEVYVMNADGSDQKNVSHNLDIDVDPSWSPDGKKIAFASARDHQSEIYLMDADGANQTRLTYTADKNELDPDWSPDGTKIAFVYGVDASHADLGVMDPDGSNVQQITSGPGAKITPSWSLDGSHIYFAQSPNLDTLQTTPRHLYSIRPNGSGLTQLTSGSFDEADPAAAFVPSPSMPSPSRPGGAGGGDNAGPSSSTPPGAGQVGLAVKPRRTKVGRRTTFRFLARTIVQGREVPVSDAAIRFAGKRARTDREGRAKVVRTFRRRGTYRAKVTKAGLRPGVAPVRVRR